MHLDAPERLPFLEAITWQGGNARDRFTPEGMLDCYERGWRYRGILGEPDAQELAFIRQLAHRYGSWLEADV